MSLTHAGPGRKWRDMRIPRFVFSLVLAGCAPAALADVLATYNVRYANNGDVKNGNGWERRLPVIASLIRFHAFDLFGTQEGLDHQMKALHELLPEHGLITYGRDDGEAKGEHLGIFYRKDKYQVLSQGRFWLSPTPDTPGKGWDASLPRLCTWAGFKDTASGRELFFFNIHFDHRGVEARKESAKLLLEKVAAIAGNVPAVLVGDFNSAQDSEPYRILEESPLLADAFNLSPIRLATTGTANKFDPTAFSASRIDHLFVPEKATVRRFGILTDSYRVTDAMTEGRADGNFPKEVQFTESQARLPSDHFPVVIEIEWPK